MCLLFREVYLPEGVEVRCALLVVSGMGYTRASHICDMLGLPLGVKFWDVDIVLFIILRILMGESYLLEEDLRRVKSKNIRRIIASRRYRGIRHASKLPVRGQRTHSNARTRKQFAVV